MKIVKVFPDYMSTGFWGTGDYSGHNLDDEPFKEVLSTELMIAFKYWHDAWECIIDPVTCEIDNLVLPVTYIRKWEQDGRVLVYKMNRHLRAKFGIKGAPYKFVYLKSFNEEDLCFEEQRQKLKQMRPYEPTTI